MEGSTSSLSPVCLPLDLSTFIGRETEIGQVAPLILAHRLITLTGSAGAGKSRLAFEVARRMTSELAQGVRAVELAPLTDAALTPWSVAQALGLVEPRDADVLERLVAYLEDRELLLILDGCDHLIEAAAQLAELLLRSCCADLRILATAREPLGVAGELVWPVPPLPAPPPGAAGSESFDAVRLFVERAREASPGFALTPQNAPAIAAICRRLDGMPLAIELAAARAKVLTLEQIEARLADSLSLLSGGGRRMAQRHRTIRAAIEWSYELLDEPAKAVLHRLSVFRGGCTVDAAAAVCADVTARADSMLDTVTQLVDKSLVVARVGAGEMRYHLLEVIRQYALERLQAEGAAQATQERHLVCCLALAEHAKREYRSERLVAWLERLDLEQDNLRAALGFALEQARAPVGSSTQFAEYALRLASALGPYWRMRGHFAEGSAALANALAACGAGEHAELRGLVLMEAANLALFQGDPSVQSLIEESVAIWRGIQPTNTWALASALRLQGMVHWSYGDTTAARELLEESLGLFRGLNDELGMADALWGLGATWVGDDDDRARELEEQGLVILEKHGDIFTAGRPRYQLADLHLRHGEYGAAKGLYEKFLAESRRTGDKYAISACLWALGRLARITGNLEGAWALFSEVIQFNRDADILSGNEYLAAAHVLLAWGREGEAAPFLRKSLDIYQRLDDDRAIAACVAGLASLKCATGQKREAAKLLGAVEAFCERSGHELYAIDVPDRDQCVAAIKAGLDARTLATAWAEGRALSLQQAVDLGFRPSGPEAPQAGRALTPLRAAKAQFAGLTAREREIAGHVALGKSNREIADDLVVSERTVEAHIGNILSKLGFTSRTQIATWAVEKGLGSAAKGEA